MITILGLDPGSVNYGFSVVRFDQVGKKLEYKILECGMLGSLLKDLSKPHKATLKKHLKEIKGILSDYQIDYIFAERYMTRGIKGATVEAVNQMLGALDVSVKQEVTEMPASTWKNRVNKFWQLKDEGTKKGVYSRSRTLPHEVDATLQCFWLAEKKLGIDILPRFKKKREQDNFLKSLEICTTSPLRKVKGK
jgi:Holliday junction resolvasome RuvABC endonuclease subunit